MNTRDARKQLDDIKRKLEAAAAPDKLTFVSVPVIYAGYRLLFETGRSALAFTPGLANVQVVNNKLYFPRQFGPRNAAGKDIFEEAIKARFASALFIDDWNLYHRLEGEVHCGSNTKRNLPALDWWKNQP